MKGIVIIGAGNVAIHLARALQRKSFVVGQIFSRTENSARQLASELTLLSQPICKNSTEKLTFIFIV
jgi:glutamyl-tRNA reductase